MGLEEGANSVLAGQTPSARGVARRIDHLGRVVIPAGYRKAFGIVPDDLIDMTVEGDAIVLRRLHAGCVFCAGVSDLGLYKGHLVCAACARELGSGSGADAGS